MNLRALWIIPPIVLGVLGFVWMTDREPEPPAARETAQIAVRVLTVTPEAVPVTVIGYGHVEAEQSWEAVAQVEGRITSLYDGIAEGTFVKKDDVLLTIDRTDYDLNVQMAKANLASAEASLGELDRTEDNTRRSLALQRQVLDVAQAEYQRVQNLVDRGTGTLSSLDSQQRNLLAQQDAVLGLENALALVPAQRDAALATLAAREAELAEAEEALSRTTITAPFDGRVASINVETQQFVRGGDTALTLHGTQAVEIVAEIQPVAFAPLALHALGPGFMRGSELDVTEAITLLKEAGVTAEVGFEGVPFQARYPAEPVRFRGSVNDTTGTLGLAVRVNDPLRPSGGAPRPPLNVGSFVSVTLSLQPTEEIVAIPRAAVRYADDGSPLVYLALEDDTLAIQDITTRAVLGDQIEVIAGLEGGERLILSDPRPAVPGVALVPIESDGDR